MTATVAVSSSPQVRRALLPAGVALLLAAEAGVGRAQEVSRDAGTTLEWDLTEVENGWCLQFLMPPEASHKDLPNDLDPLTAQSVSLHPAIAGVVRDQPQYVGWTPAQLCAVTARRLTVGERTYEKGDGGQPLVLVWWSVAVAGPEGPAEGARYWGANSTDLKQLMRASQLEIERVKARLEPIPESDARQLRLELEGVTLIFDGHVTPDTIPTPRPHQWRWLASGPRDTPWRVEGVASPDSSGGVAGALRIQGKRGLAAILADSPIRIFTSGFIGGTFSVRLSR